MFQISGSEVLNGFRLHQRRLSGTSFRSPESLKSTKLPSLFVRIIRAAALLRAAPAWHSSSPSEAASTHPAEEKHFGRLYPKSFPFGLNTKFLTTGESASVEPHPSRCHCRGRISAEVPLWNSGVPGQSTIKWPSQGLQDSELLLSLFSFISEGHNIVPPGEPSVSPRQLVPLTLSHPLEGRPTWPPRGGSGAA